MTGAGKSGGTAASPGLSCLARRHYALGMASPSAPQFLSVGSTAARLFGRSAAERADRLAANAGLCPVEALDPGLPAVLASVDFAWDPAWLRALRDAPRTVLTSRGRAVMAHVAAGDDAAPVIAALEGGALPAGYAALDAETAELSYAELRKRERPFVMPLDPADPEPAERAAYDAAYKGVTDILTLYLWRRAAFHLTRWAARLGLHPNAITAVGAVLCVLAFVLFWRGDYWLGCLSGFVFMVLDTVDGKLARCTGSSSKIGNILDHGLDLVHPPFWYWAWLHGLAAYGRPLVPFYATIVLWAIILGYVAQRAIEGEFIRRFKMHIHVWRPIDSKFRLVTARRNPNMIILVGCLPFGRPDTGLVLVAYWTVVSLIFHAVRLAQASEIRARGGKIASWLDR